MHTLNKNIYFLAMGLSALAGCVDAIGFLQLRGYFISFMSGNSTQLAVNLAEGNLPHMALLGSIILLFVLGTMLGTLLRHCAKTFAPAVMVLLLVTLLLASAALSVMMHWHLLAIIFMTLAMGAENAVFQRNGEVVIGLTYMTGTLVKLGQKLAGALIGGEKFTWVPYLLLWMGLVAGGITGTILYHFFALQSLWIAALWAAALTMAAAMLKRHLP